MNLSEAEALVVGYMRHPDFDELRQEDDDLNYLVWEIAERIQEILNSTIGTVLIELDAETVEMVEQYYEICDEHLKF